MPPTRVVGPDTTVLPISNGDTITVRRQLNTGEQRAAYQMMYLPGTDADGRLVVDRTRIGIALCGAYLVDWSLTDAAGNPLSIRGETPELVMATVDALDYASYIEIKEAIEKHEAALEKTRADRKNGQGGETVASAISPLPSGVTGASSGSVN